MFRETLRRHGFRVTRGRIQILAALAAIGKPATVTQLQRRLSLDPVTLYRALQSFVAVGIVRKVEFGHGHAHFEIALDSAHHHHIVCTNCSRIEDVDVCLDTTIEKRVLAHSANFKRVNEHALEFFGLCRACV